jgi:hypothetical protein
MAIEYCGHNANGSDAQTPNGSAWSNDNVNLVYTVPGVVLKDAKELGLRIYTGSTGNFRLAVFSAAKAFLFQGSAEIDVAGSGSAWLSHVAFTDQGGNPISPQIMGGTAILVVVTADSASLNCWCDTVTSGYVIRETGEYTGGYPSTLTLGSNDVRQWCVRLGVEDAISGHPAIKRFGGVPHAAVNRGVW